jgi:hypothetical protein
VNSKKNQNKVGVSNNQPGPFGGGDPLPTALAPVPPSTTEVPVKRVGARRGLRPLKAQVDGATRAADELRAAPDKYAEVFGARVPASTTVADSLQYSAGWSSALAAAEQWRAYCAEQNGLAWEYSLGLTERLLPIVAAPGSTATADLPELSSVVTARTAPAKRAAVTRKENKAAKGATAPATPAPPTTK